VQIRKRAVSIRMSPGDIRNVKRLADRLQVRDSDVIRYAVKSALTRLAPLYEEGVHGRALVPLLMETSGELFHDFALDLARLESIVNGNVEEEKKRVDREDLRLIAMHGMHRTYYGPALPDSTRPAPANGTAAEAELNPGSYELALKRYLYQKYVARQTEGPGSGESNGGCAPK
jgi:hypothetical protein